MLVVDQEVARSRRPVQCIRAPPISSSVVFSLITISTIRGRPRYIEALPSTMTTKSQNAGMYAPPAALGPNSAQTCGIAPDARTWVWKILPGAAAAGEHARPGR